MLPRIGDRFQSIHLDHNTIWEIVEIAVSGRDAIAKCLIATPYFKKGQITDVGDGLWKWPDKYQYLGNFSKKDRFTQLYEKLT